mmetsp:Transcript_69895/g.113480  ORF Transcript_69895/g.113480 Transcript_69895/m.113480 type:complete len:200 (+) Transcript_69895:74-673(+)
MSGSEELAQAEEEQVEGGEEYEGNEDDQELAAMQKELEKAEQQKAELDKLNKMQGTASADSKQSEADQAERDSRSIFIGNVDFSTSVEEVQALFADCGEINAITIPVDKFSGRAKGFAYLEFASKESVLTAMEKNNALLRDRPIKVVNKRTNLPAWQTARGAPRGGRGRAGFRGAQRRGYRGGYRGYGGGRGRGHFAPY